MAEERFTTDEEKAAQVQLANFDRQAHQGALFDDWIRHQAGQMFLKYLQTQIEDSKNAWLGATNREAAETVRLQAQVYAKIKAWIHAQIATGKLASNEVKRFSEEGVKLEGWIKDQSSKGTP
jgi:hypothetical protein